MAIQSNFPAIKPSLNLDFANTEALDPRITFTRASTATYYDGVTTAKAEENLLLRSQDYSATWTVTNLTPVTGKTAPDTTSTATEFTATAANAVLTQGFTAIAGSYTFSVFLRRVTGSGDIQIAADNGTWTTKVITGTWARYDVTQTVAAGSKTAGVRVVTDTDAIEVWGAQLEQRDAVTSYTPTTTQPITNYIPVLLTAATNAPRFDHNPTTGESLGLLIEEQRTNLVTYSEDLSNAVWTTKTNMSVVANYAIAPDGTLTADQIIENTSAGEHGLQAAFVSYTSGTSYTFSCYAKSAGRSILRILLPQAAYTENKIAFFDVSSGTVTSTSGTGLTTSITNVGNGWYRCSITATATVTTTTVAAQLRLVSTGTTASYTGDGYSGIYIWGAQLEAFAFPTSYIATVAATVTRSADAASMTGTNFSSWYNPSEGTLFAESVTINPSSVFSRVASIENASQSSSFQLARNGTNSRGFGAGVSLDQGSNTFLVDTITKQALAGKINDFALSTNGSAVATDTSTDPVLAVVALGIGASTFPSVFLNGHIRKIAYYPLRLTDAQLQALTG